MAEISFISKFSDAADSSLGIEAFVSVDSNNDFELAPGIETEDGRIDESKGCSLIFQDQVASIPFMSVEEVKQAIAEAKADKANIEPTDFSEIQMRRAQRPAAHGLRVVK